MALDEAVHDDAPIRVRALLEAGADPNARWSSYGDRLPLQEAIEAGLYGAPVTNRAEIVRLLLDHGADPNGRWCPFESRRRDADKDGCTSIGGVTPLIMAAARDQADTTYLLLDAGADPRLEDGSGANALDSAWGEAVFQLLLPVLFPDSATREADALKYLTDRWVPGGAVGPWNQTALGRVILGSRPRTHQPHRTRRVELLLDIGADPNQRTSSAVDWTPLAMAITAGDSSAVEILLARAADPNARWCSPVSFPWVGSKPAPGCDRERGTTPLMWAASMGREDSIRFLLRHGADPRLRDWQERTALDYATPENSRRIAKTLTESQGRGR